MTCCVPLVSQHDHRSGNSPSVIVISHNQRPSESEKRPHDGGRECDGGCSRSSRALNAPGASYTSCRRRAGLCRGRSLSGHGRCRLPPRSLGQRQTPPKICHQGSQIWVAADVEALGELGVQLQAAVDALARLLHPDLRLWAMAYAYLAFAEHPLDDFRLLDAFDHGGFQDGIRLRSRHRQSSKVIAASTGRRRRLLDGHGSAAASSPVMPGRRLRNVLGPRRTARRPCRRYRSCSTLAAVDAATRDHVYVEGESQGVDVKT